MLARYRTRKNPFMSWSKNTYTWMIYKPDWMPVANYELLCSFDQPANRCLHAYARTIIETDLYYRVELVGLGALKAAIAYNAKAMATCYVGDKKHRKLQKKQRQLWQILDNWYYYNYACTP
jgi:hypothetical protein